MRMKSNMLPASLLIVGALACMPATKHATSSTVPSLKQIFANDFAIGTALNTGQIEENDVEAAALIAHHFNTATPENVMKAQIIHPKINAYNFGPADKMVAYCKKNNMKVNGHTLIWHSQLPAYARNMKSVDSFKTFFQDHITTIATRYADKVYSWDVVNEALNEDGTMRKTVFLDLLGENFVIDAFRLAQAAAPGTQLYYNDYNNEQPAKRAGCIALIKKIKGAGVRIDGVGIQGHWHLGRVPIKEIEESIQQYAALGITVMFTELDIDVLPGAVQGADIGQRVKEDPSLNPYTGGLPDSVQKQLAADYLALFRLFLKYKNDISRVTFWGLTDAQSWLNGWPIRGRTNYPLLFDRSYKPKPAFEAVITAKRK